MRTSELAATFLLCLAAASPAAAQYKWVDPGGQVHYSDQPPPAGMSGVAIGAQAPAASKRDDGGVPAALRGAASNYPVVLYTTPNCAPCQHARGHLSKRGIPFAERTVNSRADAEAYKSAGFSDHSFPALTVGRERSVGFEAGEWDRLLDAAGYPKTSVLPPSYRQPPATGLAAASAARDAERSNDAGGAVESGDAVAAAAPREAPPRQRPPAQRTEPEATRGSTTLRF
jgi:glutaredoxin